MRLIMYVSTVTLFACIFLSYVGAEDANNDGFSTETIGQFTATTAIEAKLSLSQAFIFPFLQADGPLFSGNKMRLSGTAEVSPVYVSAALDAVWTPIAVLELNSGVSIGSGWNIGIANGLGRNFRTASGGNYITSDPFPGSVAKAKFGAAFQFDIGAVVPGDWNHVVTRVYQEWYYQAFSSVDSSMSWLWQADTAENRNGWKYYAFYLLGYQMPIFVSTAAFTLETNLKLYNSSGGDTWGDDLMLYSFGPLLQFKFSDEWSLYAISQWQTIRNFVDGTGNNAFYQDRKIDRANPYRVEFHRLALMLEFKATGD